MNTVKKKHPPSIELDRHGLGRVNRKRLLVRRASLHHIPALMFALLFQVPGWPDIIENITGHPMTDRLVYVQNLLNFDLPTDYLSNFNLIAYFTFEWLWNTSIAFLNRDLGLTPDQIFFFITTLVLWRFTFQIATSVGWLYVPLLLNPLMVDFAFSQLRSATGIALLSFFWQGQRGMIVTVLAYIAATAIHTSMILFGVMHLAAHWFNKPRFLDLSFLVLTGLVVAIAIGPTREIILGAIGDRRAEYDDMSSSVLYLSFWILLWTLLLARWKDTLGTLDGRYVVIILSLVAATAIFQGYSTRFIASAFPSILIAMASFRSTPVGVPIILFLPYAFLQWLYWLRLL